MKISKEYNVLDLFCGCGGLSKGFEKEDFNVIAANDIWEDALVTYKINHSKTTTILGDITESGVRNSIYKTFGKINCDVIIGGPPCQAYSNAGWRDPSDPRGKLFRDYVDIVNKLKPKVFLLENVKGMLSMKHYIEGVENGYLEVRKKHEELLKKINEILLARKRNLNNPSKFKYAEESNYELLKLKEEKNNLEKRSKEFQEKVVDMVVREFNNIGYKVEYRLLNAANYGVPQKRERVIFIGVRGDKRKIQYPKENYSEQGKVKGTKKWKTVFEAVDDLKDFPENIEFSQIYTNHSIDFLNKIKNTPVGKSVFGNYSDAFFRLNPEEPSRTVKENHGGVFIHYSRNRVMTPRELARLQSFDDNFKFYGTKSSILKQIGNAVPVILSQELANNIRNMLDNY